METVASLPVNLDTRMVDREALEIRIGGIKIVGFGRYHFRPTTEERSRYTLRVKCWEGNDTEVITESFCDARHSPQTTPLHGAEPLSERRWVPPEGRCIRQDTTGSIQFAEFLVGLGYTISVENNLVIIRDEVATSRPAEDITQSVDTSVRADIETLDTST